MQANMQACIFGSTFISSMELILTCFVIFE